MTEQEMAIVMLRVILSLVFFFLAILYMAKKGMNVVRMGFREMEHADDLLRRIRTGKAYQVTKKSRFLPGIKPGKDEEEYIKSLKNRRKQGIVRMMMPAILVLFFLGLAWLFFPY